MADAVTTPPVAGTPQPPPPTREDYQSVLVGALDEDQGLRQEMYETLKSEGPPEKEGKGFWSTAYDNLKTLAKNENGEVLQLQGDMLKAGVRATGRALAAAGEGVGKILSAPDRVVRQQNVQSIAASQGSDDAKKWLKWFEQTDDKFNIFSLGNDQVQKWIGPQAEGGVGFVENLVQATVGVLLTRKMLKGTPVESLEKGGKLAQFAGGSITGGISDFTFFDGHQARLSDFLKEHGADNPVTRFLASDKDDTELEGRAKNMLEGLMVGAAVDTVLLVLKGMRSLRWFKEGKASKGETQAALEAIPDEIPAKDPVGVVEANGKKYVVVNEDQLPGVPPPGKEAPEVAPPAKPAEPTEEFVDGSPLGEQEVKKFVERNDPLAGKKVIGDGFANHADAQNAATTMNLAIKASKGIGDGIVDDKAVGAFKELLKAYEGVKDNPQMAGEILERYGFNINYTQQPEQIINTVKAVVDAAGEANTIARGRVKSWKETAAGAQEVFGGTPEEALAMAKKVFGDVQNLDEYVVGMKAWKWAQARKAHQLSLLAELQPDNAMAHMELSKALDTLLEWDAYSTGTGAAVARAQNAQKIGVGQAAAKVFEGIDPAKAAKEAAEEQVQTFSKEAGPKSADELVSGGEVIPMEHRAPPTFKSTAELTKAELRSLSRSIFLTEGDPAAILKALRGPKMTREIAEKATPAFKKKLSEAILTFRMEAMLSGPKTQATNIISNTISMLQRPVEYWWAGKISGNKALQSMGSDMLWGLTKEWSESFTAFRKSLLVGKNIMDADHALAQAGGGLGDLATTSGRGWLKVIGRTPSRFLMGTDEFFKQMNYRTNVRAQILRKARDAGITDPAALAQRVTEDMKWAVNDAGEAVNPTALQYGRVGTFTNDLAIEGVGKTVGERLQEFAKDSPYFRFVMPFVKAPVNLFRYTWERAPVLSRFNKTVQADLKAGGERAAVARAKVQMGTAVWGLSAYYTLTGNVTGRGPSDPDLRRQWVAAGNQPYSLRIPGTQQWISYKRGDPTFAPLGLIADSVTMWDELQDGQREHLFAAILASVASNVFSKTFMQGMADFFEAMNSGRADVVQNVMANAAGSFVPNILRQSNPDDTLRETQGIVDELMARVPGFSEMLPPRRNIFGEKIMLPPGMANRMLNPFTLAPEGTLINLDVADELIDLGRALPMPSAVKEDVIDLRDGDVFNDGIDHTTGEKLKNATPYDRLLELNSLDLPGRPSLRSSLETLVESPGYQNGTREIRLQMVKDRIKSYHDSAWGILRKEYPSLNEAVRQARQAKSTGKAYGPDEVQDLLDSYGDQLKIKRKPEKTVPRGTQKYTPASTVMDPN